MTQSDYYVASYYNKQHCLGKRIGDHEMVLLSGPRREMEAYLEAIRLGDIRSEEELFERHAKANRGGSLIDVFRFEGLID